MARIFCITSARERPSAFGGAILSSSGNASSSIEWLHHICLRAKSRDDIDRTAELVSSLGATIIRGPEERDWAPGYYYVLFEDPDGIRLEVNHVPGVGLLTDDATFGSPDDYVRRDGKDIVGDG